MSILYDLSHLTALTLQGEASRTLLQGQLSCDVREVDSQHMRQGALCNLKGRVLALIDVVEFQHMQLILPRALSAFVIKNLQKPALLSRVNLAENPHLHLFGFYHAASDDKTPFNWPMPRERLAFHQFTAGCCWGVNHELSLLLLEQPAAESLRQSDLGQQALHGAQAWHQQLLQAGLFELYPSTSGLFLPHRLNLQHTGQLSFNKGCYKGQEIIARMHYRSTPKHTLKAFQLTSKEPIEAGLKINDPLTQQELGELVDYYPINANAYYVIASMLFEHPLEVQLDGHLHKSIICC